MPLYCYENSSELPVPLKRSWGLQGLWTILENRRHMLLAEYEHWGTLDPQSIADRAFHCSKECPVWEECHANKGYKRAETQKPTSVGQALEEEEVGRAQTTRWELWCPGVHTAYLKGSSCSSDLASHILQECRPRLVPIFQEKSETWIIYSPEISEFLSVGS